VPVYHRPFLAPCSTSFPTSQIPSMGFFTITWHSGSFRRLVCSTPSSSWLLSVDSSRNCPHASKIDTGSVPPDLLEFKRSWARVSFFLFFWIWISFLLFYVVSSGNYIHNIRFLLLQLVNSVRQALFSVSSDERISIIINQCSASAAVY